MIFMNSGVCGTIGSHREIIAAPGSSCGARVIGWLGAMATAGILRQAQPLQHRTEKRRHDPAADQHDIGAI
jgi:hypothetical protein